MAGDEAAARWIATKLQDEDEFRLAESTGAGFLKLARVDGEEFVAVATGAKSIVTREDVAPIFAAGQAPEFVVNVPSKAIWSGAAIDLIHRSGAAFGTFGELIKASQRTPPSDYRNKDYAFFEQAFSQHSAVSTVTRVFDRVFKLDRHRGFSEIVVALIDAYDMTAEDIRTARSLYGDFTAALKMSNYGSITSSAREAGNTMGVSGYKFGEFMSRLNKP